MTEKPQTDLRELAEAAVEVMGGSEEIFEHQCRPGTWAFVDAVAMLALISLTHISWGWAVGLALLGGWAMNERERLQTKRRFAEKRSGLQNT